MLVNVALVSGRLDKNCLLEYPQGSPESINADCRPDLVPRFSTVTVTPAAVVVRRLGGPQRVTSSSSIPKKTFLCVFIVAVLWYNIASSGTARIRSVRSLIGRVKLSMLELAKF